MLCLIFCMLQVEYDYSHSWPSITQHISSRFKRLTGRNDVAVSARDYKFYAPRHKYRRVASNSNSNMPSLPVSSVELFKLSWWLSALPSYRFYLFKIPNIIFRHSPVLKVLLQWRLLKAINQQMKWDFLFICKLRCIHNSCD